MDIVIFFGLISVSILNLDNSSFHQPVIHISDVQLKKCSSYLQLINAGKGEALRIRAILRSLVPTVDLVGIISIPLSMPVVHRGEDSFWDSPEERRELLFFLLFFPKITFHQTWEALAAPERTGDKVALLRRTMRPCHHRDKPTWY